MHCNQKISFFLSNWVTNCYDTYDVFLIIVFNYLFGFCGLFPFAHSCFSLALSFCLSRKYSQEESFVLHHTLASGSSFSLVSFFGPEIPKHRVSCFLISFHMGLFFTGDRGVLFSISHIFLFMGFPCSLPYCIFSSLAYLHCHLVELLV